MGADRCDTPVIEVGYVGALATPDGFRRANQVLQESMWAQSFRFSREPDGHP